MAVALADNHAKTGAQRACGWMRMRGPQGDPLASAGRGSVGRGLNCAGHMLLVKCALDRVSSRPHEDGRPHCPGEAPCNFLQALSIATDANPSAESRSRTCMISSERRAGLLRTDMFEPLLKMNLVIRDSRVCVTKKLDQARRRQIDSRLDVPAEVTKRSVTLLPRSTILATKLG